MLTICDIAAEDTDTWHLIRSNPTYPNGTVVAQVWWARKGLSPRGEPAWVNREGGYCPAYDHIVVLQTKEVEYYWDLPQWDTSSFKRLLNAPHTCRLGWLSPDGSFFRCAYFEHDQYANIVLDKAVSDLEYEGWLRITGSDDDPVVRFVGDGPTEEQAQYLLDNNY